MGIPALPQRVAEIGRTSWQGFLEHDDVRVIALE